MWLDQCGVSNSVFVFASVGSCSMCLFGSWDLLVLLWLVGCFSGFVGFTEGFGRLLLLFWFEMCLRRRAALPHCSSSHLLLVDLDLVHVPEGHL